MAKVLDVLTNKEESDDIVEEVPEDEIPEEVQNIIEEGKQSIGETVTHEVLQQIYSKENLAMKTDLNKKEAITFSRASVIAKYFKCDELAEFANSAKEHFISNKRQGRSEMVDVIKNSQETFAEEEPTLTSKIFK